VLFVVARNADVCHLRIEELEAALQKIIDIERRSSYSSLQAAPGEFAAIARHALSGGDGSTVLSNREILHEWERWGGRESGGTVDDIPGIVRRVLEDIIRETTWPWDKSQPSPPSGSGP
jgi:hypothetical protein